MVKRQTFNVEVAPEALEHLQAIDRKYWGEIRETVSKQLTHNPGRQTRNRKPLRQPAAFDATWELRLGPQNRFRVFYEIVASEQRVRILAFGEKRKEKLFLGRKEIKS